MCIPVFSRNPGLELTELVITLPVTQQIPCFSLLSRKY